MNNENINHQANPKKKYIEALKEYLALNQSNDTSQNKRKFEYLIALPYYLPIIFPTSPKIDFKKFLQHFKDHYLLDIVTACPIDLLESFDLKDLNYVLLENQINSLLHNPEMLELVAIDFNNYQNLIIESFKNNHEPGVEILTLYFKNALILKNFYFQFGINYESYEYHKLMALLTLTYLDYQVDNISRDNLYIGNANYFYSLDPKYPISSHKDLPNSLDLLDDFADFINLDPINPNNINEVWEHYHIILKTNESAHAIRSIISSGYFFIFRKRKLANKKLILNSTNVADQ